MKLTSGRVIPTIRVKLTPKEDQGCWHYDYTRFCTQCDPDFYGDEEEEFEPALAAPGAESDEDGEVGRGIRQRADEARARIFGRPAEGRPVSEGTDGPGASLCLRHGAGSGSS